MPSALKNEYWYKIICLSTNLVHKISVWDRPATIGKNYKFVKIKLDQKKNIISKHFFAFR